MFKNFEGGCSCISPPSSRGYATDCVKKEYSLFEYSLVLPSLYHRLYWYPLGHNILT